MKAMILAAGFGERMLPLTRHTPKPLLEVGGRPLIAWHLQALALAGLQQVVINVSHLGEQIENYCGDGSRWSLELTYSREAQPLETAGGIKQALPLLGKAPFLVVNGDIWTDYPIDRLAGSSLHQWERARLVMVDNPPQHPMGDFCLESAGRVVSRPEQRSGYTYAGLGLFKPEFFDAMVPGKLALRPLLDAAMASGHLGGEYYAGQWEDVGTPERLAQLATRLGDDSAQ